MSRALAALICIRLDAKRGQWVTVEDLAGHVDLSGSQIRSACEQLRSEGLLLVRRSTAGGHIEAVRTPDMTAHEQAYGDVP